MPCEDGLQGIHIGEHNIMKDDLVKSFPTNDFHCDSDNFVNFSNSKLEKRR